MFQIFKIIHLFEEIINLSLLVKLSYNYLIKTIYIAEMMKVIEILLIIRLSIFDTVI